MVGLNDSVMRYITSKVLHALLLDDIPLAQA
jgi:hypothetical protein